MHRNPKPFWLARGLSLVVVLLYDTRALCEFVFQPRAQPFIVAGCPVTAGGYVASPRALAPAAK